MALELYLVCSILNQRNGEEDCSTERNMHYDAKGLKNFIFMHRQLGPET